MIESALNDLFTQDEKMELLLLSNSTLPGKARWDEHALPLIAGQVKGRRSAVFIPFAGVTQSWDDYTSKLHRRPPPSWRLGGRQRDRYSQCRRSYRRH